MLTVNQEKQLRDLLRSLASIQLANAFNPYTDTCSIHDLKGASTIRPQNLHHYLRWHLLQNSKTLWLAEAGSHRGLRRTGVPLLPEDIGIQPKKISQYAPFFEKATHTKAIHSYSNQIVWQAAQQQTILPIFWNTIMMHLYPEGQIFRNRNPKIAEIYFFQNILLDALDLFQPDTIVCIGRKAERSLNALEVKSIYVRHPSNGGVKQFRMQINSLNG